MLFSLSSHGGLDLLLGFSGLESGSDDGVGDILSRLANHHVVGHVETELVGELLELLDLVVSEGSTLLEVLVLDGDSGGAGNEKEDGGEFHFILIMINLNEI